MILPVTNISGVVVGGAPTIIADHVLGLIATEFQTRGKVDRTQPGVSGPSRIRLDETSLIPFAIVDVLDLVVVSDVMGYIE